MICIICFCLQNPTDAILPHLSADYITSLRQCGTWADAVAVQGTARMLGRDIHVVQSQPESSHQGYLVNKVPGSLLGTSSASAILLGHLGEIHYMYVSLGEFS